jgi:hypothetical protein
MHRVSGSIDGLIGSVEGTVNQAGAHWFGPDAGAFHDDWLRTHRPSLTVLLEDIRDLARTARTNAAEQDVASGSGRMSIMPAYLVGPGGLALSRLWNGASSDWSGAAQAQWLGGSAGGSSHLGVVPVSGTPSYFVGAQASGSGHADVSLRNGANAAIAVGAMVGAQAMASGRIGSSDASLSGRASAFAGAEAKAGASAHAGLDGVSGHAGVGAFAGAKADASATAHIPGVNATAGVEGEAGIGAHAHVDASVTAHEVKASVDLGAAIGIGGGVKLSVDVKPEDILHRLPKWPW